MPDDALEKSPAEVPGGPAACPVCSGEARFRYALTDRYWEQPGSWDLHRCKTCGHAFLHPIPEDLGSFYDHWYEGAGWDRVRELQSGAGMRFLHQMRLKRLIRYVTLNIRSEILDVGCGQGIFLEEVRRAYGCAIAGCDTSDKGLVDMSPEPRRAIDFRQGEIGDVDFPDRHYDMVVALHVLEHVPDAADFVRQAWARVKPGGILAIEVPHYDSIVRRIWGRWWSAHEAPYHVHNFTRDSMARTLDAAGLPAPAYIRSVPLFPEMTGTVVMLFKRLLVGDNIFFKLMRVFFWIWMWFTCIPFDLFASLVLTRVNLGGSVLAVVRRDEEDTADELPPPADREQD